jgi:hypothetical protein
LANLGQGEPAPRLCLRIELDIPNLALVLTHAQGVYGPQHLIRWTDESGWRS